MKARRTLLKLYFKGVNITADLERYLQSMTYTDNEGDEADDISITIDDREGMWINHWLNTKNEDQEKKAFKGTEIHPLIVQKNPFGTGKDKVHDCGVFEIDSVDYSGPPAKVTLKATSIPYTSTLRQTKKSKVWENTYLKIVGNQIAQENGMELMYISQADPPYIRIQQTEESDIEFLQRLTQAAGISLKITSRMIVMFDKEDFEAQEPVKQIKAGRGNLISYKFSTKTQDTDYDKCTVTYTTPDGVTITGTYEARNTKGMAKRKKAQKENTAVQQKETVQELKITRKVGSVQEAQELARKEWAAKRRGETSAEITLVGDVDYCAGITVMLYGFGEFSGKYIVEKATHTLTGGYKVALKLRSCLEDY